MFGRRKRSQRDFAEELDAHLAMETDRLRETGLSEEEARAAARRNLGNMAGIQERFYEAHRWLWLDHLVQDLRFGLRQLRRNPGFTAVAVLTLALGIGATTAIFSALDPIVFEPLPYPHSERIVMIWGVFHGARSPLAFYNYREILARNHSFAALAIFEPWQPSMTGSTEPERLDGQRVSYGYFRALGVAPFLGRDFKASDDAYHGPHVATISYGFWQRRFAGDRGIVGRQIKLDGDAYTIIGVMPRGFDDVISSTAEVWTAEHYNPADIANTNTSEWGNHLSLVGRLKSGVGLASAKADIGNIARTPVAEFPRPPWASLRSGFVVDSLKQDVTRGVKPALLAVLGAVMLVLIIACVNVTNLLLARGARRRAEFAIRAALGAARSRLTRQLLTESLLLALIGGGLGLALGQIGLKALIALSPQNLPRLTAIRFDQRVFLFALGLTALVGLLVGLAPALHAFGRELRDGLKESSRRFTGVHQLTRRALVVVEVSLALVVLIGAGLLLRSLNGLFSINPGFDAAHMLTMQVQTSGREFDNKNYSNEFFAQALDRVRQVPGVESAALTSLLPLADDSQLALYGAFFEKDNGKAAGGGSGAYLYMVSPDYFKTMHIPLLRGRFLGRGDIAGAAQAVVISQSLAKEEFGNQDPIGQRVHLGGYPNWPWYTIVGVAGDVKQASLAASDPDAVYITPEQSWFVQQGMSLVVRTRASEMSLVPAIRRAIWSVNKDQPIVRVATMEHLLAATQANGSFVLVLFEVFALASLALAAVGIYGVLSGTVTERTHEIGVRIALGARTGEVLRMVVAQGLKLALAGVGIGIVGALGLTRFLSSLLYGVKPTDPLTFIAVSLILIGVALLACYIPARRAAKVDPMVALRYE